MNEDVPQNPPQSVSKTTAVILVLLYVFTAFTGYAFGVDAGYLKGRQDCSERSLATEEIRMP